MMTVGLWSPLSFTAAVNILCATWGSTAAKGSSMRSSLGLPYNARAIATRCCWPPLRVTPRSPISVSSPPGSCFKSSVRQAARTTWSNCALSNGRPITILCLNVPLTINAFWGTYPISCSTFALPLSILRSPRIAEKNELFPQPTFPTIPTELPSFTCRLKSFKTTPSRLDPRSLGQEKVASRTSKARPLPGVGLSRMSISSSSK
mmetsp:Transcript_47532/g.101654  ORF Transcript_47532/g.101654 Transcript_47532/m.101654 type:complete len:205 (+) Transcript_47532:2282-2896(+)